MTSAAERLRQTAQRANQSVSTKRETVSGGDHTTTEMRPPSSGGAVGEPASNPRRERVEGKRKAAPRQVRQADVKKTLALSPAMNSQLADWQNATARELGLARVTAQEVLESLVAELLAERDLSASIKDRLAANRT
ncbi:MAG: hypothetical protein INR66_00745 [Gordonia polyisoprenivorans]|nr:hypothetical protein [Gordonia polyisoprenivorans]